MTTASLDEAAELEQMVPVTAVARQSRGVRAQHGANFAGTQPRDEPIVLAPTEN